MSVDVEEQAALDSAWWWTSPRSFKLILCMTPVLADLKRAMHLADKLSLTPTITLNPLSCARRPAARRTPG